MKLCPWPAWSLVMIVQVRVKPELVEIITDIGIVVILMVVIVVVV